MVYYGQRFCFGKIEKGSVFYVKKLRGRGIRGWGLSCIVHAPIIEAKEYVSYLLWCCIEV